MEIYDIEVEHLAAASSHDSELSLDDVSMEDPLFPFEAFRLTAAYDVNEPKVITYWDVNVLGVLIPREYETCFTLDHEEDIVDVVTFKKDVLVLFEYRRYQQGAQPGDETVAHIFEEPDTLVLSLVNVHAHLDLELVRQLIDKPLHFRHLAEYTVCKLNFFLYIYVQVKRQLVFLVELVKGANLCRKNCTSVVIIWENWRQWTISKREGDHSDHHENYVEQTLSWLDAMDIAVSNSRDCLDGPEKTCNI